MDGEECYEQIANAIERAQSEIFMTGTRPVAVVLSGAGIGGKTVTKSFFCGLFMQAGGSLRICSFAAALAAGADFGSFYDERHLKAF